MQYNGNMFGEYYNKNTRKLYHSDIYMPDGLLEKAWALSKNYFRFSKHLRDYFYSYDSKHSMTFEGLKDAMKRVVSEHKLPFEVEVDGKGRVTKFVVRVDYDEYKDISIVYGCRSKDDEEEFYLVRTAWLNDWDDVHTTLDKDKYEKE